MNLKTGGKPYPKVSRRIYPRLCNYLKREDQIGFPHSSGISGSKHSHMRELRTQHSGNPYRTLYAFDPRRNAILLIGGDKTGNDRWYETHIAIADRIYDEHLQQLLKEGLIDGKKI